MNAWTEARWVETLEELISGNYEHYYRALDAAYRWDTCACGALVPCHMKGYLYTPNRTELVMLGKDFYDYIFGESFNKAKETFYKIKALVAKLLEEEAAQRATAMLTSQPMLTRAEHPTEQPMLTPEEELILA